MSSRSLNGVEPAEFARALQELHGARLRPEVTLTEVPAPSRIAPWSVAMSADVVTAEDEELANGRFVLLHDPAAPEPWASAWRCVTFARAELEPELANDPMLGSVGWSWLEDALAAHDVAYTAEAGTVTRVVSEPFGDLGERAPSVEMEVRASWSPLGPEVGGHLEAFAELMCTMAGLPPLPDGVVALPARRR